MENGIKLTWLGHSCWKLEYGGYGIALDPYTDGKVPGLSSLSIAANEVLCSHDHYDHNNTEAVKIIAGAAPPFTVTEVSSTHDDAGGAKRGMNTIRVFEAGGVRIAHMGDIGRDLTAEQLRAIGGLDAVMIPIGGFYTIGPEDAKKMANALGARVVLPMHYRFGDMGFKEVGTLDDFLKLCGDVKRYSGDSMEITKRTPAQTAVLTYRG